MTPTRPNAPAPLLAAPATHPRTIGWLGTTALAMGGSNQSLFLIAGAAGLFATQGSAAVPLLIFGLLLAWAALPGWIELVLMWPDRVGGIAATCAEAFRPISPVLANLTGVCYWWGWVPTCGLTAILSATAIHSWYLPGVPVKALACALVAGFTAVNLCGIKWVVRLALPLATGSALLAFLSGLLPILAGKVDWRQATTFHLVTPFPGVFGAVTSAMAGLYLIGFAAPAFEQATCHVGETRDPVRQVPRAVFASAGMATLFFLVLPLVWLGVLGPAGMLEELQDGLGPTFAPLFGQGAKAAAIWFMMLNMFHGTLAPLAGATRTLSQLAEDGLLPAVFSHRNRHDVPWVATVVTAGMAVLFLLLGDPVWLIAAANLCYLIGIGMPSVAVWLLRRQAPEMARPYRAPRGTIGLGVAAAVVWAVSAVLGFQQFGLPTVLAGFGLAYSGSLLFALRRWRDTRRRGERGMWWRSLHVKLTGAMLLVLAFDGAGYVLAVNSVDRSQVVLKTVLEDIFVAVALLTISVGLVLPGIIANTVSEVARAADRLATGTLADLSNAMQALARGRLDEAHAGVEDLAPVVVSSRDEVGAMAVSFNVMQQQVIAAASGLDGAREGLRTLRDTLGDTNRRLEERVAERTAALLAARQAEERLQIARDGLETRVRERTRALADANDELGARAWQQAVVSELGQHALESVDLDSLMDDAGRLIAEVLDVGWTAILERSPDGRELRMRAGVGWAPGMAGSYTAPVDHSTPAGHALLSSEPLIVEDTRDQTVFNATPHMRDSGIGSAMILHIGGDQNPFGVVGAYAKEPRSFTHDNVYFVRAVANVLAAAIQRKRADDALRVSQAEAERANLAKSEFLSRMSHELRTPLNAILGFGQLLELDVLPARQGESVAHILKAGRHLLGLIDEVLDISRIEAGRLDLALKPLRVADVLDEVLGLVEPLADKRLIRLERPVAVTEYVLADAQRLKQVLLNLLSNAVKYNRERGLVRVGCGPAPGDPSRVQLTVSDTGMGISLERRGELFSPFARLGAESSGVEGNGLGLALSKRLVEAQNGTIELESQPGEGSTFTVTLPAALAPEPVPVNGGGEAALIPFPPARGNLGNLESTRRVLLVEDNLSNLELVRCMLGRRRDVGLLVAMRGRLGLEMALQHRPDLILLDLHLPDLPGEEVLRQIRANPDTRDIPVVIVSADAIPAQIHSLLAAGATDYLTKPLDVKRFLEVLEERLNPDAVPAGAR